MGHGSFPNLSFGMSLEDFIKNMHTRHLMNTLLHLLCTISFYCTQKTDIVLGVASFNIFFHVQLKLCCTQQNAILL